MKKLLAILSIAILVGCATKTVNSTVFNIEKVLATGAKDTTHVFNQQYHAALLATNPPANIAQWNAAKDTLYKADEDLGKSIKLITTLRQQVVATSGTNVTATSALAAAITVAQAQFATMAGITNLVNFLK